MPRPRYWLMKSEPTSFSFEDLVESKNSTNHWDGVRSYQARISGPLLDRIDLHVELSAVPYADIAGPPGESSSTVARRVGEARARQDGRTALTGARTNADLGSAALQRVAWPDAEGRRLLEQAMDRLGLTGRGHDRLLRVARTIADLDHCREVAATHVAEALQFRDCRMGEAPDMPVV